MKVQSSKKNYILWADDDADDLEIFRETLDLVDTDYQLIEAANGQEVLDYLSSISNPEEYPCLIILDNNMPLMSGRDTLSQIKKEKRYTDIPVAIFSTSISKQDNCYYHHLGAQCYTKPDNMREYRNLFSQLLTYCNK